MFAIIQVGSKQYKVAEGDTIQTLPITKSKGKSVSLDKVLFFAKGADIRIGQPYLKDVKVTASLVGESKGKKVTSFKFRRRKSSSSKKGHRAQLLTLNITQITAA